MSTFESLTRELERQPEEVLQEVRNYLAVLIANGRDARQTQRNGWPEGYFEEFAGAFENEPFERPAQLPLEKREQW